MDMSLKYLEETAAHLRRGFEVRITNHEERLNGALQYEALRIELERPAEFLRLEGLSYPDGTVTYWLELVAFHGLSTFSFQLDSWKYRDDRIEFKYYPMPDGRGMSFVLSLVERFDSELTQHE